MDPSDHSLSLTPRMVNRAAPIRPQIYDLLYRGILKLEIPPGRPLSEPEVSEALGVSRGPVREVFIRLANEGLVEIYPQVGTFVSLLDAVTLMEAIYVRDALEPDLAARTAARISQQDARRLRAQPDRQREAASIGDLERVWELDDEFHRTIAELSGLPGVWKHIYSVRGTLSRLRTLELNELDGTDIWIPQHTLIADAIARKDTRGARDAMRAHINISITQIEELKRRFPEFFSAESFEAP